MIKLTSILVKKTKLNYNKLQGKTNSLLEKLTVK